MVGPVYVRTYVLCNNCRYSDEFNACPVYDFNARQPMMGHPVCTIARFPGQEIQLYYFTPPFGGLYSREGLDSREE